MESRFVFSWSRSRAPALVRTVFSPFYSTVPQIRISSCCRIFVDRTSISCTVLPLCPPCFCDSLFRWEGKTRRRMFHYMRNGQEPCLMMVKNNHPHQQTSAIAHAPLSSRRFVPHRLLRLCLGIRDALAVSCSRNIAGQPSAHLAGLRRPPL